MNEMMNFFLQVDIVRLMLWDYMEERDSHDMLHDLWEQLHDLNPFYSDSDDDFALNSDDFWCFF